MKKITGLLLTVVMMLGLSLVGWQYVVPIETAQAIIEINPEKKPKSIIPLNKKAYEKSFVVAEGKNTVEQARNLTQKLIDTGRMLLGAIAVLLGLTGVVQLIVAQDKEEEVANAKKIVLYSVVGLMLVALAADLSAILDLTGGGLLGGASLQTERLRLFDDTVRIVVTFMKYMIGAVAILMLIITGLNLVTTGSNEEEAGKSKKNVLFILGGLFGLLFVDNIIRNVLYKIDRPGADLTIDLGQGIREVVGFTNLIVTFAGPVAILTLVAGGVMYAFSFGNEESQSKAKKMMIVSLAGIVAIYGAFGIVSTVISGKL